jgi:DNA methyltransferase 1-associated protein 1
MDRVVFYHYICCGMEFIGYPYSHLNVHLDPIMYMDEEYWRHLSSDAWTRGETDSLMDLAWVCELWWVVMHNWWLKQQPLPHKVEDLQHRHQGEGAP